MQNGLACLAYAGAEGRDDVSAEAEIMTTSTYHRCVHVSFNGSARAGEAGWLCLQA